MRLVIVLINEHDDDDDEYAGRYCSVRINRLMYAMHPRAAEAHAPAFHRVL